jgi:hypothetical protein
MLDAHQDLLSRKFCGEGIPPFYIDLMAIEKSCPLSITGILTKYFFG